MSSKKNKQEEVLEQVENTAAAAVNGQEVEPSGAEDVQVGVAVHEDTVADDTAVLQEGVAEIDTSKPVKFVVTYPHGLNLRIGPGRNFAVKKVIPFGSTVEGIGECVRAGNTDWVPLADGWVDGKYLTLAISEE